MVGMCCHCLTAWVCASVGTGNGAVPSWVQLELLESLAVGPGLGGMFAQVRSFSIVIWGKLSLPPAFGAVGRGP